MNNSSMPSVRRGIMILGAALALLLPAMNRTIRAATHCPRPVVVAVIDDGIDFSNPALSPYQWINVNEKKSDRRDNDRNGYIDDVQGWDFTARSGRMRTNGRHGTNIAQLIIANSAPHSAGACNLLRLMPLVVQAKNQTIEQKHVVSAIYYAVNNGAHIINVSLGGSLGAYSTAFDPAIDYAYSRNVLIVAAAGNSAHEDEYGQDLTRIKSSPVCNDRDQNMVLGVGSVSSDGTVAIWSNVGKCVDLFAPGSDTVVASTGTSISAALVSAAASQLKISRFTMSSSEIRDRLITTADTRTRVRILNTDKALRY